MPSSAQYITATLFSAIGIGITVMLSLTLYNYPLTHWDIDNIHWSNNWLFTTVLDYYGSTLCLVVITFYNEPVWQAIIWSLCFCLLGSPTCCIYIVYRCLTKNLRFTTRKNELDNENVHLISRH